MKSSEDRDVIVDILTFKMAFPQLYFHFIFSMSKILFFSMSNLNAKIVLEYAETKNELITL